MNFIKALTAYLIPLLLCDSAAAAPVRLAEVLQKGLKNSLNIQKAQSGLRASESQYRIARSSLMPTVNLKADARTNHGSAAFRTGFASTGSDVETYNASVEFNQPLYRGGAVSSGLAAARLGTDSQKQEVINTKQDHAFALIRAYFIAAHSQRLVQSARENRDILKSYAQVTARYANIGRSKNIDRLSSEAMYNLSEAALLQAESEFEMNLQELYRTMGEEIEGEPVFETVVPLNPIDIGTREAVYQRAIENNPELKSLDLQVKREAYANDVKMAEHLPSLNLTGAYGYNAPDRPNWFEKSSETWNIGLTLTIPLFSGFSSFADRSVYKENSFRLQKDYELLKQQFREQLAKSAINLDKSFRRLKLTQLSAASAKKAMDVALRDYRTGLISSTDVNQIQSTKYNADKQNISAQLDYHLEVLSLRRMLGTDLEKTYVSQK